MEYDFFQQRLVDTLSYMTSNSRIEGCVYVTKRAEDGLVFEGTEPPGNIDMENLKEYEVIICDGYSEPHERWKHAFYPQSGEDVFIDEMRGLPEWRDVYRAEPVGTPTGCLMDCAGVADREAIGALLLGGADPTAWDSFALRKAAWHNNMEAVKALIEAGADANARNGEALISALHRGNKEIAQALFWAGARNGAAEDWLNASELAPAESKTISEEAKELAAYMEGNEDLMAAAANGIHLSNACVLTKKAALRYVKDYCEPGVQVDAIFSEKDIQQAAKKAFGEWIASDDKKTDAKRGMAV